MGRVAPRIWTRGDVRQQELAERWGGREPTLPPIEPHAKSSAHPAQAHRPAVHCCRTDFNLLQTTQKDSPGPGGALHARGLYEEASEAYLGSPGSMKTNTSRQTERSPRSDKR